MQQPASVALPPTLRYNAAIGPAFQVNVEVKVNDEGVRGIFATKAIKADEHILSVPASAILNAGGVNDSFAVGQVLFGKTMIMLALTPFATQFQVPFSAVAYVPGANLVGAP